MFIKQVSVFLENKPGSAAEATEILGKAGINVRALSLADTSSYGILHLIVDDPDRACAALREANMASSTTDVLAVSMGDTPGALGKVLRLLVENKCNVEYAYAFITRKTGCAAVILRVDDAAGISAELLRSEGIELLTPDEAYSLA